MRCHLCCMFLDTEGSSSSDRYFLKDHLDGFGKSIGVQMDPVWLEPELVVFWVHNSQLVMRAEPVACLIFQSVMLRFALIYSKASALACEAFRTCIAVKESFKPFQCSSPLSFYWRFLFITIIKKWKFYLYLPPIFHTTLHRKISPMFQTLFPIYLFSFQNLVSEVAIIAWYVPSGGIEKAFETFKQLLLPCHDQAMDNKSLFITILHSIGSDQAMGGMDNLHSSLSLIETPPY